jgi:hypothetical protein
MTTIIPKVSQKIPLIQSILPYFALVLLIAVLMSYFVLNIFENRAWAEIDELEEEIKKVAKDREDAEKEVLYAKDKIDNFSLLLAGHQKPFKFFELIEKNTHSGVVFNELELRPELLEAKLGGSASSFVALGQQIYILQKEDQINEIKLSDLSLGTRGEAVFLLELSLSPELFK